MWYNDKKDDYKQAMWVLEDLKGHDALRIATHEQYVSNESNEVLVDETVLDTVITVLKLLANSEYVGE